MPIPKLPRPLLALCLALPLGAFQCGADEVRSTPAPGRFERVAMPAAPAGEALCATPTGTEPCLSDRELGALLDAAADAICAANDRLAWKAAAANALMGGRCIPQAPFSQAMQTLRRAECAIARGEASAALAHP